MEEPRWLGGLNMRDEYFGTPDLNWRDNGYPVRESDCKEGFKLCSRATTTGPPARNLPEANWDHEAKWDFDVFLPETVTGQSGRVCDRPRRIRGLGQR